MLLTAQNIADEFRVDIRTIYGWRKAGLLPAPIIIRRRMLWENSDIAAYKNWLKQRADARQAGVDPDTIERPNYLAGPTPMTEPEKAAQE